MNVELDGLFRQNTSYDYDNDYEYKEEFDTRISKIVWAPFLYSLVLVVGLLGNILLLAVLAQKRRSWRMSDTFILQLGVTDILLLVTLPFRAAQATGWCSGVLCKICGAVFNVNFYCGIFLLVCITLDHYLSTVHAFQMYSHSNPRSVHISCLSVWLVSLLLTIPDWIFLVAEKESAQEKMLCVYNYSGTTHLLSRLPHHTVGFVLPAVILIVCCFSILLQPQCRFKGLQRQRAILRILCLVVVFFICWVPYNLTLIVDTVQYSRKEPQNESLKAALSVTSALGCIHACLRPLLFLSLCGNFRNQSLALLRCATVESKGSLWELEVGEEALPDQNHVGEEMTQMTSVEQQVESTQC